MGDIPQPSQIDAARAVVEGGTFGTPSTDLPRYAVQYLHGTDEEVSGCLAVPEPGLVYKVDAACANHVLDSLLRVEWPRSVRRNVLGMGDLLRCDLQRQALLYRS